jgi:hypothetical protein
LAAPPLSPSPPMCLQPHHLTLAPHLLLSKVPFLVAWIYVAWCKSPIGFGGGKKGGRKGRDFKGIFCDYLLFDCAAISLNRCYICELVEVLSRNLVGGRTTVVLVISGNFSWVISGDQWENHVELCHTFPTSTYALDSELYFSRYRCLNPGMLLSKKTDLQVGEQQ